MRVVAFALLALLAGGPAFAAAGQKISVGALTAEVPSGWQSQPPKSNFRLVQFQVPRAAGDTADAEFVVFFFKGDGGSADDNIARWRTMFKPADGGDGQGKVDKRKARNGTVTTLDISGTYLDRPAPGAPHATERQRYRMLSAVLEVDKGPYYLRLVGPSKTVEVNKAAWDQVLRTLTP